MATRFILQWGAPLVDNARRHAPRIHEALIVATTRAVRIDTLVDTPSVRWSIGGDPLLTVAGWQAFRLADTPFDAASPCLSDLADVLGVLPLSCGAGRWAALDRLLAAREDHAAWLFLHPATRQFAVYRDPVGTCSLYAHATKDGWQLTNCGGALAPWLLHDTELRDDAVAELVTHGYVQNDAHTLYASLQRLPQGCRWTSDSWPLDTASSAWSHTNAVASKASAALTNERWWHWRLPELATPRPADAIANYRDILIDVCRRYDDGRQAVIELSGGMDSSSVAAAWASTGDLRDRVTALTFRTPSGLGEEHPLAARTSARFGLRHASAPEPVHGTYAALDPRSHALLPPLAGIHAAYPDARTIVSGHGGDTLFQLTQADVDRQWRALSPAAWLRYAAYQQRAGLGVPPLFLRQRITGGQATRDYQERAYGWLQARLRPVAQATAMHLHASSQHMDGRTAMIEHPRWRALFECRDPGWTQHPLAYRFPLFDLSLLRFVASLPAVPFLYRKHVVRAAFRGVLPDEVLRRPKTLVATPRTQVLSLAAIDDALAHTDIERWLDPDTLRRVAAHPERVPQWMHLSLVGATEFIRWRQFLSAQARHTHASHP